MNHARRAWRWWHVRRTLTLSFATLAVVGLAGAQALRWKDSPAVYAVSVLVTAQIALVLGYLLVRHLRRQAPRESSLASVLGVVLAVVLTVATPSLRPEPAARTEVAVVVPAAFEDPPRVAPAPTPIAAVEPARPLRPETAELPARPPAVPQPPVEAPPPDPEPPPARQEPRDVAIPVDLQEEPSAPDYHELLQRLRRAEQEAVEQVLRRGLPSESERDVLPPMHIAAGLYLGHLKGRAGLTPDASDGETPLGDLIGSETFETAAELMADFPLAPRDVLRVSMAGLRTAERGFLGQDLSIGSAELAAGSPYAFDLQWAHMFVGFGHRFLGYTRESRFDICGQLGVMADSLTAALRTSGADAETFRQANGWAAPALGLTLGVWDMGRGGLVVEILQSVPVNFGRQTLALTDLRLVIQHDLTEAISIMVGYRRITGAYRSFDKPFSSTGLATQSTIDVGGPLAGIDVRF